MKLLSSTFTGVALFLSAPGVIAQDATDPLDDEDAAGEIVVTSMRVRQGGAQDIRHFRASVDDDDGPNIPRPENLTIEGLMGEHDLTLPVASDCRQMFCIVSETMPASLALRPDDHLFVGLGFATNIQQESYKRPPLNLVAVVDKSGSMNGTPLARVRKSLSPILWQMTDQDQMSIVLYGDQSHVWLEPTPVRGNRDTILAKINSIASAGSTNMEAGLKVGYQTAFDSRDAFTGSTWVMLFTDENPNVGNTSAESFMRMAQAASEKGVGLTTIGVGVIFDAALATKVSSVRGGNLFYR